MASPEGSPDPALERLYAKLYHRRDRLWMKYDIKIKAWSLRLAQDVAIPSLVHDIFTNHELAVHESTASDRQREQTKQTVLAALLLALSLYKDLASNLRDMVSAASAEGMAVGQTTAAALLAHAAGANIPDMGTLQKESLAQLQQANDYWDNTDHVVNNILNGLAGDVAKSMSKLIASGATEDQLVSYVTSVLGVGAGAAFYLDSHIHALFALAALAMYKQAGSLVDFVTVGDERVCPECDSAEAGNPWKPSDVPDIPNHGGCRCWYAPAQ